MKRIVSIIILTLCYTFSMAQSYTHEDSVRAVKEYVAWKYLDSWVDLNHEEWVKNKTTQDSTYQIYVAFKEFYRNFDEIVFSKSETEPQIVVSVLSSIGWGQGAIIFNYIVNSSNDFIKNDCNFDTITKGVLLAIKEGLKPEIYEKISSRYPQLIKENEDKVISKISNFRKNVSFSESEIIETSESDTNSGLCWIWIAVSVIGGGVIGFVVAKSFKKEEKSRAYVQRSSYQTETRTSSMYEISQFKNDVILAIKNNNSQIESMFEKYLGSLSKHEVRTYCSQTSNVAPSNNSSHISTHHPSQVDEVNTNVIYVESFRESTFRECSSNKAQYKLTLYSGNRNTAEFEFCGNTQTALSNKSAQLSPSYCTLEGDESGIKSIRTIEKGRVEKQPDGYWKVTRKARLRLE